MADVIVQPKLTLSWVDLGSIISGATSIDSLAYLGKRVCLAGGNNGSIARSTNYGRTWTDLGSVISGPSSIDSIVQRGGGICLISSSNGRVARSIDYGNTWTDLGDLGFGDFLIPLIHLGGGILLAFPYSISGTTQTNRIIRSVDWGLTWKVVSSEGGDIFVIPHGYNDFTASVYLGEGVVLVIANMNDGLMDWPRIYKSIDYGLTWDINPPTSGKAPFNKVLSINKRVVIGAFSGSIYRSVDRGSVWSNLGTLIAGESSINSLAYLERGICLAGTGTNGKIARSNDYGLTWSDLGTIVSGEASITSLLYLGHGRCLAGTGTNGKIARSDTWRPCRIIGDTFFKN